MRNINTENFYIADVLLLTVFISRSFGVMCCMWIVACCRVTWYHWKIVTVAVVKCRYRS